MPQKFNQGTSNHDTGIFRVLGVFLRYVYHPQLAVRKQVSSDLRKSPHFTAFERVFQLKWFD
jgi:hypothetical protein